MDFSTENIQKVVEFLYGVGGEIECDDNGNQIVVSVIVNDDEFGSYFFKIVIYKSPFKITEHGKTISREKMKNIKKLITI